MGTNKNKIKVSFPGNSAEDVTGSMVLIETKTKKILVECGLTQGESTILKEYNANNRKFPFRVKDINYVVLCHAHADHTMRVPLLYKRGCEAEIIAPIGMKDMFKTMGEDSAFIMAKNAESLSKKSGKEYPPIYEIDDVYTSLKYWKDINIKEKIKIDDDIEVRFVPSGHILNSYQCELWIKNNNHTAKVAITSDLGNPKIEQYYTNTFEPIEKANLLIGETTYGDEERAVKTQTRKKDLEKIKTIIRNYCVDNNGKVLIPSFALQRGQVMLTYIYEMFGNDENFNVPIILDSALMLKMNNIFLNELEEKEREKFQKVLEWENIKIAKDFAETDWWIRSKSPVVFISSGGMLQAGRALYTATQLLPREDSCIVFCGYSAEGTLGWKIKNAKKNTIKHDGKNLKCRCQTVDLKSFTSHMQRNELLQYYSSGNFDKVCLVHGNMETKLSFGQTLKEELERKNKTTKVCVVNKATTLNI